MPPTAVKRCVTKHGARAFYTKDNVLLLCSDACRPLKEKAEFWCGECCDEKSSPTTPSHSGAKLTHGPKASEWHQVMPYALGFGLVILILMIIIIIMLYRRKKVRNRRASHVSNQSDIGEGANLQIFQPADDDVFLEPDISETGEIPRRAVQPDIDGRQDMEVVMEERVVFHRERVPS